MSAIIVALMSTSLLRRFRPEADPKPICASSSAHAIRQVVQLSISAPDNPVPSELIASSMKCSLDSGSISRYTVGYDSIALA
jgi:hypothetical protein